ncbi:uncharacterized protein LOC100116008 [Nasonia vitripennis]|uniref:Uncharacterized protein n=1 Tax=Nasonia vitripennis TaxID=7425 RepID=A0A7M7H2Q8_NASVI|nr:uncharacterized protein LOC100116008 [Nasonia vitripennis]
MAPNYSKIDDKVTVEEVVIVNREVSVSYYIFEFFVYLEKLTGFKKEAFTRAGMQSYLKNIGKQLYQMDIRGDLLEMLLKVVKIFTTVVNKDTLEASISLFIDVLHKVTRFLFTNYVGERILFITSGLSSGMSAFVCAMFFIMDFIFNQLSANCFYQLKTWILCFFRSEKITQFFDYVFGTYGRAITVA